ncbi:MAG: lipopolysaccharide biosynthesis protein [Francisellaceae bacterium]
MTKETHCNNRHHCVALLLTHLQIVALIGDIAIRLNQRMRLKHLLKNEILIKSILTMFVQGLGQITAFATAVLLARTFSVDNYGQYMFGVTVATIAAVIATLGADAILARSWGWADQDGLERNRHVFELQHWFFRRGILLLLLAMLTAVLYLVFLRHNFNKVELTAALFALPFFIANLLQSFFVATKRVVYANLIQFLMRLLMLGCVLIFFVIVIDKPAALVFCMFISISTFTLGIWLILSRHYGFKSQIPGGGNLSFMLLKWGNLLLSQVSIIILKVFSSDDNIAYYAVALQLSALVAFVLNAVSSNIMAQVAHDFKHLKHDVFQQQITGYTRIIVVLSLIVVLLLIVSGYWITLLYGKNYTIAYYLFCVLMIGQIVNVLCGSVYTIMNMAGLEKLTVKVFYAALILNITVSILLVLKWNAFGIAVAASLSMIFWNLVLTSLVIRKLHINPTIFALKIKSGHGA